VSFYPPVAGSITPNIGGSITAVGDRHYRLEPRVSPIIATRQEGLPSAVTDIAWKAQLRLTAKYKRLCARRVMKTKAVVAVARELAGFVWAIGREVQTSGWQGGKLQPSGK
jgi:transposase